MLPFEAEASTHSASFSSTAGSSKGTMSLESSSGVMAPKTQSSSPCSSRWMSSWTRPSLSCTATPGIRSRSLTMAAGTAAVTDGAPTRRTAVTPLCNASTSSVARASSFSTALALNAALTPSAFAWIPWWLRSNSLAPKQLSTSPSILLIAGWLRCNRAAAPRIVAVSESATRSSRCLSRSVRTRRAVFVSISAAPGYIES